MFHKGFKLNNQFFRLNLKSFKTCYSLTNTLFALNVGHIEFKCVILAMETVKINVLSLRNLLKRTSPF